jgi:hypothetical protein
MRFIWVVSSLGLHGRITDRCPLSSRGGRSDAAPRNFFLPTRDAAAG